MREMDRFGQAMVMIWLLFGGVSLLYLMLWPFSLRLDARLSPTSGRAEIALASLMYLRLEGDFLQPSYLKLYRLDGRGRRSPLVRRKRGKGGFVPVLRQGRLVASLYVGLEDDGALTVEALGMLYALLQAVAQGASVELLLRPTACFDKNICALRLSGIGRFVLAQNIFEYLKGKHIHAKR